MLNMFDRRIVLGIASGVVVVLAAMGALWLLFITQSGATSGNGEASSSLDVVLPSMPNFSDGSEKMPMDSVATDLEVGVDPRLNCDKPLSTLSDECLQSLDDYFLDKPFVWNEFEWIPLPLTYRRIFEDPATDRERVFDALERPECRLEEGEVRWDLKETCHANSFANYANFLYFCQYVEETWKRDVDMAQNYWYGKGYQPNIYQRYADWDTEHRRSSKWAGERFLEGRWVVESVCDRYDTSTLALDADRQETLEVIWKRLGENTGRHGRMFQVLRSLAARLGDEWASLVYESPMENDAWDVHEAELMPWKSYLKDMRSTMNEPSMDTGPDARQTAMKFALVAWGKLEKGGMVIELDQLVEYVCGPNWQFSSETCQDALAHVNETETVTDQSYWHRLAKFEARAIQLDLYDVVPSYRSLDWESKELRDIDPEGFRTKWTERRETAKQ